MLHHLSLYRSTNVIECRNVVFQLFRWFFMFEVPQHIIISKASRSHWRQRRWLDNWNHSTSFCWERRGIMGSGRVWWSKLASVYKFYIHRIYIYIYIYVNIIIFQYDVQRIYFRIIIYFPNLPKVEVPHLLVSNACFPCDPKV